MPPRDIYTAPFGGGFFWYRLQDMTSPQHIIALHGAGMQGRVWEQLVPHLPLPCTPVSFPGHGGATGPLLPSVSAMAGWLSGVLDGHEENSTVLMGHSMGALVALASAAHSSVAALVLLGAAPRMPVHPDLLAQAREAPAAAADLIMKWGVAKPNADSAVFLRGLMVPETLFSDLNACNEYDDDIVTDKPVLVLAGADDKLTKAAESAALAQRFPSGRYCALPAAGHMLMAEKPAEIAEEIRRFLGESEG